MPFKEPRMVTQFQAPNRAKAAQLGPIFHAVFASILLCLSLTVAGQSTAPGKAIKGAATAPGKAPTAVIHTTAGDMKCELFPDKAPKTVANFAALAKGTKTWTDPSTGKPVNGKPPYDGVILHRVIP